MMHQNELVRLKIKRFLFHPFTILAVAAFAVLIFVGIMAPLNRFAGDQRFFLLYYHAPVGFAFVVFLFDRLAYYRQVPVLHWFVDFFVTAFAISRTIAPLPFFSGHALFLSYALLTVSTRLSRLVMILVLLDAAIVKIFWIHDGFTLTGGIMLGLASVLVVRKWAHPYL